MDAAAKQQIVERVKQATNILVTVSANPSVDQLSACIGLTLLINKMGKHATAVFSGKVPSTLEFLQPEKTIETNTDSLQDFIISLDKNKADKLRYKVEDKVVRIFITPYRTSLSQKDLIFSQGDFNVEVVIALGIKDRSHIDQSIAAHGRILHDATVISLNAGQGTTLQLGQLNWQDPTASSLCEMLVSISEAFGPGLIDNQMATAFLTGIVAETTRFSNNRTSPKVMTMAAQLMAAGANQQLIVSKLEPPPPAPPLPPKALKAPPPKAPALQPPPLSAPPRKVPALKIQPPPKKDGALSVSHAKDMPDGPEVEIAPNEIHIDKQGNLKTSEDLKKVEKTKVESLPQVPEPPTSPPTPIPPPPPPLPEIVLQPPSPLTPLPPIPPVPPVIQPPKVLPEIHQGHSLLKAGNNQNGMNPPFTADTQSQWIAPYDSVPTDPFGDGPNAKGLFPQAQTVVPPSEGSTAPPALGLDNARNAVQDAFATAPFDPATAPALTSLNVQTVGLDSQGQQPAAPTLLSDTPSLSLPGITTAPTTPVTTYMPPGSDIAPPAPPNMPPPLPLASNPGAMLPPTSPTFQPPGPPS